MTENILNVELICFSHCLFPLMSLWKLNGQKHRYCLGKPFFKSEFQHWNNKATDLVRCLDHVLKLSKNHLEKDGKIVKKKISQQLFLETSPKSKKGSVCWRRAQVHQSRKREDMGLFRGLGLVFKDLSRDIKEREAGKHTWAFIILSTLCVSWVS